MFKVLVLWSTLLIAVPFSAEVGLFGDPSILEIEGNESFTDETISLQRHFSSFPNVFVGNPGFLE